MQSYIYIAQKGRINGKMSFIYGCLQARNLSESYHNAKFLVRERGGNVTNLIINKL